MLGTRLRPIHCLVRAKHCIKIGGYFSSFVNTQQKKGKNVELKTHIDVSEAVAVFFHL